MFAIDYTKENLINLTQNHKELIYEINKSSGIILFVLHKEKLLSKELMLKIISDMDDFDYDFFEENALTHYTNKKITNHTINSILDITAKLFSISSLNNTENYIYLLNYIYDEAISQNIPIHKFYNLNHKLAVFYQFEKQTKISQEHGYIEFFIEKLLKNNCAHDLYLNNNKINEVINLINKNEKKFSENIEKFYMSSIFIIKEEPTDFLLEIANLQKLSYAQNVLLKNVLLYIIKSKMDFKYFEQKYNICVPKYIIDILLLNKSLINRKKLYLTKENFIHLMDYLIIYLKDNYQYESEEYNLITSSCVFEKIIELIFQNFTTSMFKNKNTNEKFYEIEYLDEIYQKFKENNLEDILWLATNKTKLWEIYAKKSKPNVIEMENFVKTGIDKCNNIFKKLLDKANSHEEIQFIIRKYESIQHTVKSENSLKKMFKKHTYELNKYVMLYLYSNGKEIDSFFNQHKQLSTEIQAMSKEKAYECFLEMENELFKNFIMEGTKISERDIHSIMLEHNILNYKYKYNLLINIYEKNINNLSIFWQDHFYLDTTHMVQIDKWFKKNKEKISNIDLESLYICASNSYKNLFFKELIERRKKNIIIEKTFTFSKEEQKLIWAKGLESFDNIKNSSSPQFLKILTCIQNETLDEMSLRYQCKDFNLVLNVIAKKVGENSELYKKFKFIEKLLTQSCPECQYIKDIKHINIIKVESFSMFDMLDNMEMLDNNNGINKEIQEGLPTVYLTLQPKQYLKEALISLNKDGLENTLDIHHHLLFQLIYLNKLDIKSFFKVEDELRFWQKICFYKVFSKQYDYINTDKREEQNVYVLQLFHNIQKNFEYVIPEIYQKDKLIECVIEISKESRNAELQFNSKYDFTKNEKLFLLAMENNIIQKDSKYIFPAISDQSQLEQLKKLNFDFCLLDKLWLENRFSHDVNKELFDILLKNFKLTPYLLTSLIDIGLDYFPNISNIKGEYSIEEKIEILSVMINKMFMDTLDVEKSLDSFYNLIIFCGGRKNISEYMQNNPYLLFWNPKTISTLYYYYNRLLLEDNSEISIKLFRDFEKLVKIISDNKQDKKHSEFYCYIEYFKNKRFNAEALLREIALKESMGIKTKEVKGKGKI